MMTSVVRRERMSRADTAWLRLDNDVNLMPIVGVWLLRPAVSCDALCRCVEDKSSCATSDFRQRVVRDAAGAFWCDDDGFDIHHHVVREKLLGKRGQSERAALKERNRCAGG